MSTTQNPDSSAAGYANPDVLVSTEWVAGHLDDPGVRIVESDEDVLLYETGTRPGGGQGRLAGRPPGPGRQGLRRPGRLRGPDEPRLGIANDTTVVFYGDKSNWWAAYAYWFFRLNGHERLKLMNGGRQKWLAENRPLSRDVPHYSSTDYKVGKMSREVRAFLGDVLEHIGGPRSSALPPNHALVDVRSPAEYRGELLHMADYPQEGALRGGHIPFARSIPWAQATNPDGTFRSADELRALYGAVSVTPDKDVVVYCRIGERSSHTWFVLHELLGYPKVRNYDGSWTEWGNTVRVPIER